MMWEEKVDILKKDFSQKEFHIPFTDGSDILKKIEGKFIIKQDAAYFLTNWAVNIKSKCFIKSETGKDLSNLFQALNETQSYWVVAMVGDTPTSKQYVYSCSPKAIQILSSITSNDFFIVDKKLTWFTHFHHTKDKVKVNKSGPTQTPFG